MPADVRDKVFEPFFTTKNDGTGIGLSLCHRIVSDHKGVLLLIKAIWAGLSFDSKFPLERACVPVIKYSITIVDDEKTIREGIMMALDGVYQAAAFSNRRRGP